VIALGDGSAGSAAGPAGGTGAAGSADRPEIPLLAGRQLVRGAPAAYVCRDFVCRVPVTDAEQLRAALSS
jgi:uncharacterized protein YyaL (SSP411 family)